MQVICCYCGDKDDLSEEEAKRCGITPDNYLALCAPCRKEMETNPKIYVGLGDARVLAFDNGQEALEFLRIWRLNHL